MPVTELSQVAGETLLSEFGNLLGIDSGRPEVVLDYLFGQGAIIDVDILADDFSIGDLVRKQGLHQTDRVVVVLCNGRQYRSAIELSYQDLVGSFDYIWYPPAEDAVVLDKTLSWALSFAHYNVLWLHTPKPLQRSQTPGDGSKQ